MDKVSDIKKVTEHISFFNNIENLKEEIKKKDNLIINITIEIILILNRICDIFIKIYK